MKLGVNGGFTKISNSVGSIQPMIAGGQRPVVMEKSHEKCPSCKSKVWFCLVISQAHLPTIRCSKSRRQAVDHRIPSHQSVKLYKL